MASCSEPHKMKLNVAIIIQLYAQTAELQRVCQFEFAGLSLYNASGLPSNHGNTYRKTTASPGADILLVFFLSGMYNTV